MEHSLLHPSTSLLVPPTFSRRSTFNPRSTDLASEIIQDEIDLDRKQRRRSRRKQRKSASNSKQKQLLQEDDYAKIDKAFFAIFGNAFSNYKERLQKQ